jgi:hypothetical protein
LPLSSHSNYPGRQTYCDNVRVREGDARWLQIEPGIAGARDDTLDILEARA